ncbi:unnamed protein product, partial [Bubo scandiacus]
YFIHLFVLSEWPIIDSHYDICPVGLPLILTQRRSTLSSLYFSSGHSTTNVVEEIPYVSKSPDIHRE